MFRIKNWYFICYKISFISGGTLLMKGSLAVYELDNENKNL